MAIAAARRPSTTTIKTWLVTNWPAALWLLVAIVLFITSSRNAGDQIRQAVEGSDLPEHEREALRQSLTSLHLSPEFIGWVEVSTFLMGAVVSLIIGWLLIRRPPRTGFACYLAFWLLASTQAHYPPDIDDTFP